MKKTSSTNAAFRLALVLIFLVVGAGCQGKWFQTASEAPNLAKPTPKIIPKPADKQAEAYYHFMLSNLFVQEDNDPKAIEELQKALALKPDSPFLEFSLGRLFFKSSDTTKALLHTMKAINLYPKYQEAYNLLA